MKKILFLLTIVTFFSCGKADRDKDKSNIDSKDHALSEWCFNDVFFTFITAIEDQSGLRASQSIPCATISIDTTSSIKTILIDFGTTNCIGNDGQKRRGIIYATLTGKYTDSLCQINLSTNNYYLNDYKVESNKIIINNGRNSAGNIWFTVITQNAILTAPNLSYTARYTANQTWEWITGFATTIANDDSFKINGTAEGATRKGNNFTVRINTALIVKTQCPIPVSGKITIEPTNLNPRYVDYGNGACDMIITVNINGEEVTTTID